MKNPQMMNAKMQGSKDAKHASKHAGARYARNTRNISSILVEVIIVNI